jgi:hypothetical protein
MKRIKTNSQSDVIRKPFRELSLAEKDFLVALGLWLVLEGVGFFLAPRFGLIDPGERLMHWFFVSMPVGIVGAILIGASSQAVDAFNHRKTGTQKLMLIFLGQVAGGVGLAGVMFPLVMVLLEFLVKTFTELMRT